MRIDDPNILAIADLYRESVLGEAINTSKGSLTGKDLVSALVTVCMSKWFDLTSKFRSRPEIYDIADAASNPSYNVMKMTPGADASGDAFEAITKTTNDIAKELNRLFGKDVFEPRISRTDGKLEALVAFKQAKGGVFQAKGEPSEGHTIIHLTMPKEDELDRAFSAMTDTPHAADGQGFEDLESDAGEAQVAGEVSPDYDPEFDVPSDVDQSAVDAEYGSLDPLDDLSADEADAMFDDEEPRMPSRSAFESLYQDALDVLSEQPQPVNEFFGRNRKDKVRKDIGQADVVKIVNAWVKDYNEGDSPSYEIFLLAQLPYALMPGQDKGFNFVRIDKEEFIESINDYFNEELFNWDESDFKDNDFDFEVPGPDKMRVDMLQFLSGIGWNPISFWAKEMLDAEMSTNPEPMIEPQTEATYELSARHKDGRTRKNTVQTGDAQMNKPGGAKDQARAWQKSLGDGWTVDDVKQKDKQIGEQAKPVGYRIRIKTKDGDTTSEVFDTKPEAERARRTKPEYRDGTIEPVMEACGSKKKKGDKKRKTNESVSKLVLSEVSGASMADAVLDSLERNKSRIEKYISMMSFNESEANSLAKTVQNALSMIQSKLNGNVSEDLDILIEKNGAKTYLRKIFGKKWGDRVLVVLEFIFDVVSAPMRAVKDKFLQKNPKIKNGLKYNPAVNVVLNISSASIGTALITSFVNLLMYMDLVAGLSVFLLTLAIGLNVFLVLTLVSVDKTGYDFTEFLVTSRKKWKKIRQYAPSERPNLRNFFDESIEQKKKVMKRKKFKDYMKEEAPAVSVGAATAANSSPDPDVIRDAGKPKKKKPMKRTDEAVQPAPQVEEDIQDVIDRILGSEIRFT